MTTLRITGFLLLLILSISCNKSFDCKEVLYDKPNRVVYISSEQLYQGCILRGDNRFSFQCAYLNEVNVNSEFDVEVRKDRTFFVRIKRGSMIQLKKSDVLRIVFWDSRKHLHDKKATVKIIEVHVDVNDEVVTPCDSITHILYESLNEKLDKLTSDEVRIVQLYDSTLNNTIKHYLNSLNPVQKRELDSCSKSFELLNWLDSGSRYGFANKDYELPVSIKSYLRVVGYGIAKRISEKKWTHKNFVVKCVGYADERSGERSFVKPITIQPHKLNLNDGSAVFFSKDILASFDGYFSIDSLYSSDFVIDKIDNNDELSTVRAFAAIKKLKYEIAKYTRNEVDYRYYGAGVSPGTDHDVHRKIEIFMELKGARGEN